MLRTVWLKLRSLGQPGAVKQEIDDERRFHIEQRTAENIAAGISKKPLEFRDGEPGIPDDLAHRECVDRIVARDDDNPDAVAHDRVLSFADDLETGFLQGANGGLMAEARQLGHKPSDGDMPPVLHSFVAGGALATTAGEFFTPNGETFFGLDERYRVIHDPKLALCGCRSSQETQSRAGRGRQRATDS